MPLCWRSRSPRSRLHHHRPSTITIGCVTLFYFYFSTFLLTTTFMSVCCLRTTATAAIRINTKTSASAFLLRSSARQHTQTHTHGRRRNRMMSTTMAAGSESEGGGEKFPYRLIDSHLHVWTPGEGPFPYAKGQTAPPGLQESGTKEKYMQLMEAAGVEKSLIVQPILYLYDHSYVQQTIAQAPHKFKGMLNANPTLTPKAAVEEIRTLHKQGFGSIRYNPYIWPAGEKMDNPTGQAMYAEAGRLNMPVGFMLFKGLHLHLPEVTTLLRTYPQTPAIIDHWGFFHQEGRDVEEAWQALLALHTHRQLTVKISAFFRVSSKPWPFVDLAPRLEELVKVYGSERLMWGSDFPYVTTLGGGYVEAPRAVLEWKKMGLLPSLTEKDFENLFSGTFVRVLGE